MCPTVTLDATYELEAAYARDACVQESNVRPSRCTFFDGVGRSRTRCVARCPHQRHATGAACAAVAPPYPYA